ncbi:hypothetical protein O441_02759, partial [Staphylococcus aureus M0314]
FSEGHYKKMKENDITNYVYNSLDKSLIEERSDKE